MWAMREQDIRRLAVEAGADVRTVKKLLKEGELWHKLVEGRIRAAAKKLKLGLK